MAGNKNSGNRTVRSMTVKQRKAAVIAVSDGERMAAIAEKYGVSYQYINRLYRQSLLK